MTIRGGLEQTSTVLALRRSAPGRDLGPKPSPSAHGPVAELTPSRDLAGVTASVTRHARGSIARHRHDAPYVALVLEGGYVEAGDGGRWRAAPGTVLVHGAHDAHLDIFETANTRVLNLVGTGVTAVAHSGIVNDVDAIARIAERDPTAAAALLASSVRPTLEPVADWPDLLATAIRADPAISITQWAWAAGLQASSVSRGFVRCYGVSPKRYRREHRARRALAEILAGDDPLAQTAVRAGFADQAHMTRAVREVAGETPGRLRDKSIQSPRARPG